ncbi:hypothetical protein L2E82_44754 [Cichorium intybus]|uniref:Uncharacterized protein n=1 Tax=Cichorium intybus TaxID=13427 RepID=A0ACB8ZS38_CICIN|nr:hypothetical protein L2E82_44754 [Cichorium intybus]
MMMMKKKETKATGDEEKTIADTTPKETLKVLTPSPSPKSTPIKAPIYTKDENLMYSPIKDSGPTELKALKDEYFDARANMFAEEFEADTIAETATSTRASPSKPNFTALFRF